MTATTPRAAIYIRVSSVGQEDGFSLDTQEERCRAYAAQHGYEVSDVYREVFTGVELWERPQLTALREAVRRHEVDAVIAYAIDRLARDPVHLGVVLSEAEHAGVPVLFVTEPLDDSPEGQLIRFVRGYAAKVEHEKLRERAMRGRRARAESGKLMAGNRPLYGYQWRDSAKTALVPNAVTTPIVQRIFREVAAGTTMGKLAKDLTEEGITTPTGNRHWNTSTISGIIHHPYYCGDAQAYRYHYVKQNGRRIQTLSESPISLTPGTVPALIDEDTWRAAQDIVGRNKQQASRRNKHPEDFLLRAGFVVCGACGRPMHADSRAAGPRYVCFGKYAPKPTCDFSVSIRAPELDRDVWERVATVLGDPEVIRIELAKHGTDGAAATELPAVERALREVDRKRANLARAIAEMNDPELAAPLTDELQRLGLRHKSLAEERDSLAEKRQDWEDAQARLLDLELWLDPVREVLADVSYPNKRLALEALGARIGVYPAAWNYPQQWQLQVGLPIVSTSS